MGVENHRSRIGQAETSAHTSDEALGLAASMAASAKMEAPSAKASLRMRTKTEKAREAEERNRSGGGGGGGGGGNGEVKGENSRRRPRTAELPHDGPPSAEDACARAHKHQRLEGAETGGMRRGMSVEDMLSDSACDNMYRVVGEEEVKPVLVKSDSASASEAEEAWGAAAALMELFSRERVDDPKKTAIKSCASNRRDQAGMPPPHPVSTPRSNPVTPRKGGVGISSHQRGASTKGESCGSGAGLGENGVKMSPRGGKDDREASSDITSPALSPRGAGDADGKHNKYCHFCQHIKVKKAKSMRACTNPECARRFCEHCLSVHMSEALEAVDADDDWLCPICRKVCCCAVQSCTKNHRHCKAYRYRLRRAELAAKRGSVSASSSAAQTPRDNSSSVPPPPPLSSLRAALEAGFALAARGGERAELDTARELVSGTFNSGALPLGSSLLKAAAAAAAAASAASASAVSSSKDKADTGGAPSDLSDGSGATTSSPAEDHMGSGCVGRQCAEECRRSAAGTRPCNDNN